MLNTSRTRGPPLEVFASECAIDSEGSASSFCRGDNYELHVLDDVAGHENTGDAGSLVLPALDAAVTRKLTSQRFREP